MWAPVSDYARCVCVYAMRVNECMITARVKVFSDCLHAKRGGSLHVHSQLKLGMRHRAEPYWVRIRMYDRAALYNLMG